MSLPVATFFVAACATQSALAPVESPLRLSFEPGLIATGADLARIGNCADCHTAADGKPYAGGRPLKTPFGTIYGTNITPDPETGIGKWPEAAFARAMREGIDREGRHLYPAFPYDHFTRLTDDDVRALYAFVMTREPVRATPPPNRIPFPRALVGIWKSLYFEPGVFRADTSQSAEWNRGAYLVQGLGHCGACHTPRNALGAELKTKDLGGGLAGGWHAPALNADSPAPVPWTDASLYRYLRTGLDDLHAIAAGPMDPVVRNLAAAPDRDVRAIATYVAALSGRPTIDRRKKAEDAMLNPQSVAGDSRLQRGAAIYAGACGTCHDQGRDATSGAALHLALGTAMTIPTSANLIRITLEGIEPPHTDRARYMPGFASALKDEQVKDLVAYIRAQFGREAPWRDVDDELSKARRDAKR